MAPSYDWMEMRVICDALPGDSDAVTALSFDPYEVDPSRS
jgi:hypothetical protein